MTNALLKGVYVGAIDPAGVRAFAEATKTTVNIAGEYLPAASGWDGLAGVDGSLAWLINGWADTDYRLSLGVPMLPTDASGTVQGTLAEGAAGAYNHYFTTLAEVLVAAGRPGTYLRLGWEFDGNWYPWAAQTPELEASYAEFFRQIVASMRAVKGAGFGFVWNPDGSAFIESGYEVGLAWPGPSCVDYVGIDLYDWSWVTPLTPQNAWDQTIEPALAAAANFAKSVGKPLAVCEWAVTIRADGHGLGDDPLYVKNMAAWMKANDVAYECYFNQDQGTSLNCQITGGDFPESLAAFTEEFG